MGRTWKPPRYAFPRAAVIGFAFVLIAPVVWLGLPLTGLWESKGPPTASADGVSEAYWGNMGPSAWGSTAYDATSHSVVVAFRTQGQGLPGSILVMSGVNLANRSWIQPNCNPAAVTDVPGSSQVIVLCQLSTLNWELLPVNTVWQEALPPVALPGGNSYDYQIVLDSDTGLAFLIQEPSNLSNSAHLVAVNVTTGTVVTNVSVSASEFPFGPSVALGPAPGTVFWMDSRSGEVQLLNSATGVVLKSSDPVGEPAQAIYYDPATSRLFLPTDQNFNTTVLSSSNLSAIAQLPYSSQFGAESDPAHGETYLYGLGEVTVVRSGDFSLVGTVSLPVWADLTVYDPSSDQFAGSEDSLGGGPTAEVTSISRAPVIGPAFSSVSVVGANLPTWLAGGTFLLGAGLLVASRRAISAALKRRQIERDRQFAEWMAEPWVDKWTGDSRAHPKER